MNELKSMTSAGDPAITSNGNVERLRTDAMVAQELRDEIVPLLEHVCRVLGKARREGLNIGFACNLTATGVYVPAMEITKPL